MADPQEPLPPTPSIPMLSDLVSKAAHANAAHHVLVVDCPSPLRVAGGE